jgi:hypothetical protein
MLESLLPPIAISVTGVPFVVLGLYCLRQYEADLRRDFFGAIKLEILIEAIGAGSQAGSPSFCSSLESRYCFWGPWRLCCPSSSSFTIS